MEPDSSDTFTKDLLQKLFEIAQKKDFSRKDFVDILGNPVLRASRGVTPEDVDAFKEWINNMNVYRDAPEKRRDDWKKSLRRLLLSRLTTETVADVVPYEDFNSSSDQMLEAFISIVDGLEKWIDLWKDGKMNLTKIDDFKEDLRSWIHVDPRLEGFDAERLSYAGAIGSFRAFDAEKEAWQKDAKLKGVSIDVVERTVLAGAMTAEYSPAELFTGGLTICSFSTAHVIPSRYTFLLGMDAKNIPGADVKDTLDLRKPGDYIPRSQLNRRTFFTTIRETEEELYISYVNQDLAKDEEFFKSPLIDELQVAVTEALTIDETRPYKEIFTNRAFRNKERNDKLTQSSALDGLTLKKMKQLLEKEEAPKTVTISQLKNFLEDPFIFHINRILHKEEEEQLNKDFEPLQLDGLQKWDYLHKIVASDITKEDFKKEHEADSSIPDAPFSASVVEELFEMKDQIVAKMKETLGPLKVDKKAFKEEKVNLPLGGFTL